MRSGGAGGGLDLFIGGIGAAEADVLPRRGGEDHRVLRHQRHGAAETSRSIIASGPPVQQDAPRPGS
jgi:hypothetical protein